MENSLSDHLDAERAQFDLTERMTAGALATCGDALDAVTVAIAHRDESVSGLIRTAEWLGALPVSGDHLHRNGRGI